MWGGRSYPSINYIKDIPILPHTYFYTKRLGSGDSSQTASQTAEINNRFRRMKDGSDGWTNRRMDRQFGTDLPSNPFIPFPARVCPFQPIPELPIVFNQEGGGRGGGQKKNIINSDNRGKTM